MILAPPATGGLPQLPQVPFEHAWAVMKDGAVVATGGDVEKVYPLASVTKVIATWAALAAVDAGMCSLDDQAGPPGATVRQLLAHASGLPLDSQQAQLPPLTRRIYSNAGIEAAMEHVEATSRIDTATWIEQAVLAPLGMRQARVDGSPAHSGFASVEDLVQLLRELAAPTLIGSGLAQDALTVQFPALAGVVPGYGRYSPCPWGLGVEIRGDKANHWTAPSASPQTFGHFGVAGSFVWVDPVRGMAGAFLGEQPFGAWHKENWAAFNQALVDFVEESEQLWRFTLSTPTRRTARSQGPSCRPSRRG